jgi:hypothetical protein
MVTKCGLLPPELFTMKAFGTPGAGTIASLSLMSPAAFSSIDLRVDEGMLSIPESTSDVDNCVELLLSPSISCMDGGASPASTRAFNLNAGDILDHRAESIRRC